MRWMIAVACLAVPAQAEEVVVPAFKAESAGVSSVYAGDWQYMVGGGAAVFDCDADGFQDLYLAGGEGAATFYRNASVRGGALAFEAQASGLELTGVTGAYPLDIDSDAVMDLVVLRVGENVVMHGLGSCRFERANEAWGFDGGDAWSVGFAAMWERGAVWPTLAVGNYIDRKEEAFPWGSCTDNWLHRGGAAGFEAPLPLVPSYCALSLLFSDWNRSGLPALRVSNDREYYKGGQEQLWRIEPGAAPVLYTEADGWKRLKIWGMGIASTDLTGDGRPEYFQTSMADNKLQSLMPDAKGPTFGDIAFKRGVTAHRPYTGDQLEPSTAWHAQFDDVNNDGLADLFIVKGNVDSMPDFARDDPNNLLVQRPDGTFLEAGEMAGVASKKIGRGGALADFNLDGLLDMVVVNRRAAAEVWRNVTPGAGGFLSVQLAQPAPNGQAVGAWVEVRRGDVVSRREITSGGGHAGGQAGWWHFGLGADSEAEVRVIWPDGMEGPWQAVAANGFYTLSRGAEPVAWVPAR